MKRFAFLAIAAIGVGVACSSSDNASGGDAQSLPTATNTFCVTPSAAAQDVALPNTGGVTGTLSFAAYPSGAAGGCDAVKIATGADIEGPTSSAQSPLKIRSNPANPAPILTVSVGEGLNGNPIFGDEAIISGLTLNLPANLNFADGTYYATITMQGMANGPKPQLIAFTAKGGVLTVAPLTNPLNGTSFPVVILSNTSAVISLYARGVSPIIDDIGDNPDSGLASDGGHVDISDAGLPPLSNDLPPHGDPMQGFAGYPPPDEGAQIGYVKSVKDASCTTGCSSQQIVSGNGGQPVALYVYGNAGETITYELNIAYMQLRSVTTACPSDYTIIPGYDGTGQITIPASDYLLMSSSGCQITYSTAFEGQTGGYYTITLNLLSLP